MPETNIHSESNHSNGFEVSVSEDDPSYENGWEEGWCEGWKDVKGEFFICPIPPIPPLPEITCSEGFRCGYNRGFKYGMCKAMGRNNCKM